MGVKDLWSVLSPVCEKKSLWELEGTSIAIDLSAWICDSNSICSPQVNMYLRNLFFRTSYLLLLGVKPVFVLEGEAPELKADVIRKRLQARGADKPVKETDVTKACSRRRLKGLQKQCVELLSYMGIECVTARGEAEALCAHLNAEGVVTGVITQDSDVFLYGAKEVYRNFQLAPHYTCDAYRAEVIQKKLNLSRTKLIGFSILSGSDYNDGINKIGKATIVKFLSSLQDKQVFQKFLEWRNGCYFDRVADNKFVTSDMKLECSIRDKALKDDGFPYLEVIAEFTADPERPSFHYKWSKPSLPRFVAFAVKKLAWEDEYAVKKFLPLLGRWHLTNGGHPCDFSIVSIVGNGQGKNANKYKVAWDQYDIVTAESKEMVAQCYSHLVEAFEESRNKKRKPKSAGTGRGRKKKAVEPPEPSFHDNQSTLTQILAKQPTEAPSESKSMSTQFNDFDDPVFPSPLIDSNPVFGVNEIKQSSSTFKTNHAKVNGRLEHDISIDLTESDDDSDKIAQKPSNVLQTCTTPTVNSKIDLSPTSPFNNFEFDDPIFSKHKLINLLTEQNSKTQTLKCSSTVDPEHRKAKDRLANVSIDLTGSDDDCLSINTSPTCFAKNYTSQIDRFSAQSNVLKRFKFDTSVASDLNSSILSFGDEGLQDLSSVIDNIVSYPQSNPALDL
ncbi:hypothetical protein GE061_004575 [Apolygus lucorum]|uniref:XPG-I domain-containing protein n=1 Tax=Apolygus lucorum TaxID=248454 RepID=A0A8S9WZP0_APOLU|nr:hypothetical protein GE061_004575 [Apolygus lucorum]